MDLAFSKGDFLEARKWISTNQASMPPKIHDVTEKIFNDYWDLLESKQRSLDILKRLREQMGFLPKSEKGSQEKHASAI